ncbi:hypothetical protein N7520_010224 [Penicillium odoratum]|uniref:uncharacterized protein n=1 Tax=Penicillium odoratum TaxID=1167516 RepID=UPI002547CB5D|nr:uncharacterized protein N7520_010224 [Penicillium odoratum]KAJ5753307.1 hypothetical protein N7520_010224 [Penicillium odoratum]
MAKKSKKGPTARPTPQNVADWPDPPAIDSSHDLRATAAKILKTAVLWKSATDENRDIPPPPAKLQGFFDAVISLAKRMTDSELLAELQRLRAIFDEHASKQADLYHKLQASIDTQAVAAAAAATATATSAGRRPMDYRAALRSNTESSLVSGWLNRAHTNGTLSTNGLSTGSAPAPQRVLREDLQLIIRGTERSLVDPLRRHAEEVVHRANRTIKDVCDEAKIAPVVVSTGFVLPSGDVLLRCDSVRDVRQLTDLCSPQDNSWCAVFGPKAHLKRETFSVVMHGVPISFDPSAPDAATRLRAQNVRRIPSTANIMHIGWLMPARKMQGLRKQATATGSTTTTAKLVIEFDDPDAANQAILLGLALQGRDHDCQFFDGSHRLQQCFQCQSYGHIARNCRREIRCAYCAGSHDSKECAHARNRASAKCAVCIRHNETAVEEAKVKINHFAFERECPRRAEQLDMIRINRLRGPQLHRTATAPTPSTSTSPAAPTPAEAYSGSQIAKAARELVNSAQQVLEPVLQPARKLEVRIQGRSASPSKRRRAPSSSSESEDAPLVPASRIRPKTTTVNRKLVTYGTPRLVQPMQKQWEGLHAPSSDMVEILTPDVTTENLEDIGTQTRGRSRRTASESSDELSQEAPTQSQRTGPITRGAASAQ